MNTEPTVFKYKVSDFEGPLDMLLQLIAKHKMNIYDIEISALLEQYMEQINQMQENQMDVSSEFLEMASRLVYIKSVSLLPKYEEAEELKKSLRDSFWNIRNAEKWQHSLAKLLATIFTQKRLRRLNLT